MEIKFKSNYDYVVASKGAENKQKRLDREIELFEL